MEYIFGEKLLEARKNHKEIKTQIKLALSSGVSKSRIASIERGDMPTKKEVIALCDALQDDDLKTLGISEIEFKRTHPEVTICFADNTPCWKCGKPMKTVYGVVDNAPIPPGCFNETMLKISREKGVILEERRSGVTGETHLVNVCPHCGNFIGEFYLHELWYEEKEKIKIEDVSDFIIPDEE